DTAVAHAELSKYFQSGMTASVEVVDTRTAQRNLTTDSRPNANTSQVNLRLNIPLLKYSGEVSASGYLNSARKQQEAAIEDYKFFLTTLVRDTVAAYWDYRLATESAQIREKSRDRVMRITDQVDLFTSSPNPAKEKLLKEQLAQVIYTATGARANRSQALIAAQQQAEQARTNLAMMLGVPPEQFTTLSQAGDEIPKAIIPKEFDVKKYQASWRKTAMENRLDLRAANLRQDAVKIMVNKAERDLYPQVDLNLSAGYQGLSEGNKIDNMWNALNDNVPGPNWSAGLEFRYPIGNQAAEGTLDSSRARLQQAGLAVYQTIRGIHAGVDIDAGYVERYVKAISKAEQAVAEYTEALAAWKRKPLTDPSSILGMLQTESQLTESYINMLAIRAAYAQTVADIRQKTGLLGSTGNTIEDYSISYSDVTMLPGIN
ncbi:MAG: TolC family protein, partial [Methylococcaceae bacterium]